MKRLVKDLRYYLPALVVLLFSLVSSLALPVSSVLAQASAPTLGNGFSISPVESLITVNKGTTGMLTIYVENPTRQTLIAQPVVNDFTASTNETGQPSLILNSSSSLPSNNFKALVGHIASITIPSGQQDAVQVSITVPKNANPGGYYGAIRFVPAVTAGQSANIGLTASVGSLVLLTVPGNLVQKLSVVGLGAEQNNNPGDFFTSGNIGVFTKLDNIGNIHVAPFGKIEIKDWGGTVVDNISFNTTSGEILPASIRKFTTKLPSRHWFGRYTIIANLGYGSNGSLVTAQTSFWYLPNWFLILVIVVIIVVVALIYWLIHKINRRRIHDPGRR